MAASKPVLILGSSPNVMACKDWPKSRFSAIVAINNAWQVRDDWDYHIAPDDFPQDRHPADLKPTQQRIGSEDYVPANNLYGGIVYAGGTMAFSAGYWALATLKPSMMVFAGCDMIYPKLGKTHFYGAGTADPLRQDITLRNLEAKSVRLMMHAAQQGCTCVRALSKESRLLFPSVTLDDLTDSSHGPIMRDASEFQRAKDLEQDLGYMVESGRYWESTPSFDVSQIDSIDDTWLNLCTNAGDQPLRLQVNARMRDQIVN